MQHAFADTPPQAVVDPLLKSENVTPPHQAMPWDGLLRNSAEALEAQVSIWKLQLTLGVMRAAAAAVGGVLLIALGVYGFVQLDAAAHAAMIAHTPPWVSPLVRGLVYVMIPVAVLKPVIESVLAKDEDKEEASNAC